MNKERPIIFNSEMVQAILDGRKPQTRRPVRHIPDLGDPEDWCQSASFLGAVCDYRHYCPFGVPGDRLWVREAWGYTRQCDDINGPGDVIAYRAGGALIYEGDESCRRLKKCASGRIMEPNHWCPSPEKWIPSIHMPRWASRITLEIASIRVERLQDISEADIINEGCPGWFLLGKNWFIPLWNSIYGNWDLNPWVWVVEFEVVK